MGGVGVEGPWSRGRGLLTRAGPACPARWARLPRARPPTDWVWFQLAAAAGTPFTLHHRRMTAGTVGVHYRDHELLEVI